MTDNLTDVVRDALNKLAEDLGVPTSEILHSILDVRIRTVTPDPDAVLIVVCPTLPKEEIEIVSKRIKEVLPHPAIVLDREFDLETMSVADVRSLRDACDVALDDSGSVFTAFRGLADRYVAAMNQPPWKKEGEPLPTTLDVRVWGRADGTWGVAFYRPRDEDGGDPEWDFKWSGEPSLTNLLEFVEGSIASLERAVAVDAA